MTPELWKQYIEWLAKQSADDDLGATLTLRAIQDTLSQFREATISNVGQWLYTEADYTACRKVNQKVH